MPEVLEVLNKYKEVLSNQRTKVHEAKREYLLQAIDKSENLKGIFPDLQLEEIRDKLLSAKGDIGIFSMMFGTVDEEMIDVKVTTLYETILRQIKIPHYEKP